MNKYQQALNQAFQQGVVQGQASFEQSLQQHALALRQEFNQKLNPQAGGLRKSFAEKNAVLDQKLAQMSAIANMITTETSGPGSSQREEGNICRPGMVRIEDIPGQRIPFVMLFEIPIARGSVAAREQSFTVNQDGPFVAEKRMATFLSSHQFSTTDPTSGDVAQFSSRSNGRFRPVSSGWDLLDSQHNTVGDTTAWWYNFINNANIVLNSALPSAVLGMPSSMSSFRTMEFDGRITVIAEGSGYPRQNISVPSSFWSTSINAPWSMGCLDFFERNETVSFRVTPTHVNNPPAGNVDQEFVFPQAGDGLLAGWPFLEGQYDAHEGIATPEAATLGDLSPLLPDLLQTDSVTRLEDGILILGYEGYRIGQPVGVAP